MAADSFPSIKQSTINKGIGGDLRERSSSAIYHDFPELMVSSPEGSSPTTKALRRSLQPTTQKLTSCRGLTLCEKCCLSPVSQNPATQLSGWVRCDRRFSSGMPFLLGAIAALGHSLVSAQAGDESSSAASRHP